LKEDGSYDFDLHKKCIFLIKPRRKLLK